MLDITPSDGKPSQHQITVFDLDQLPHDQQDVDMLYRIYAEKRIDAQKNFYKSRIKENNKNADFTFATGAFVMTVSSLVATVSASIQDPFWTPALTVASAMLPAFAALLASFRQLYGWERQASIYRDALLGLERVNLLAPDNDRISAADLRKIYPQLVTESETVFTGEVSQWGQFVVSADQKTDKGDQALQALFNNVELTDEQRASMQSILNAGKPNSDMSVTSTVVKQVTATTQPPAAASVPVAPAEPLPMDSIDLAALEAAAASEVETPMAQESLVDTEGLNAAAASEVSDDDEDIPGIPPVDDKSDTAAG
jgi:hypothetical protein